MKKKLSERAPESRTPKPLPPREDTAYLVREELDETQEWLKAGAAGLQTTAATPPVGQPAEPATGAAKPIAALGDLWPSSDPSKGEAA